VSTNTDIQVEQGIPYGAGKLLDVYRPGAGAGAVRPAPTVLLWHGVGPDERDVMATLATATAAYGLTVVVPDWRSDAPDEGRAHLLASLAWTLAPTTGGSPIQDLLTGDADPVPFWLVHGTEDTVVPVKASREFAGALTKKGWPFRFEEQPTDHAGVILTEYDRELGRCVRATAAHAVKAGELSASLLAEAAAV
jgi:alpha-beta hydrolase superfamily lysophospholipase